VGNIKNILQNYKYISTKSSQGNDKTINDGDMKGWFITIFDRLHNHIQGIRQK